MKKKLKKKKSDYYINQFNMRNFKTRYVTETEKSELQVSTDGLSKKAAIRRLRKEKKRLRLLSNNMMKEKAKKIFGKKIARGSRSKPVLKRGGDNMHYGGGKRGRNLWGNSLKHKNVCPCHPSCEPGYHKRINNMFQIKQYLKNYQQS